MKHLIKKNLTNIVKVVFLILLTSSNYIIVSSSKIKSHHRRASASNLVNKNEFSRKINRNNVSKKKIKREFGNGSKGAKETLKLENKLSMPSGEGDDDVPIIDENEPLPKKQEKLAKFFKRLLLVKKAINILKKKVRDRPKNGCLRVFDKPNFESKTFVDLCTDEEIKQLETTKTPRSILIPDDLKVVFYRSDTKEVAGYTKLLYTDVKEIRNFPFAFNEAYTFHKFLTIKLIREGDVFITDKILNYGTLKILNKNTTSREIGFNTIGSVILGKNTYLKVINEDDETIQVTKDSLRTVIKNFKSIEIVKKVVIIPQIDPDCIMVFKEAYFVSGEKEPELFCTDAGTLNVNSVKSPLASKMPEEEKKKSPENLDNISAEFRLSIGSILIGKRVTAVIFKKPYLEGTAYQI